MNNRRVWGWLGFIGVCALIAWVPQQFFDKEAQGVADDVSGATSSERSASPAGVPKAVEGAAAQPVAAGAAIDLFAPHSWIAAAPVITTQPAVPDSALTVASQSSAPPLPFQFIGRVEDRQRSQVFLQNGERLYVVKPGDVIEGLYRLEKISTTDMKFVYLPLHLTQTLSVGSTP